MNKKYFFILTGLLCVSGCDFSNQTDNTNDETPIVNNYYLPSKVEEYNSLFSKITNTITYTYDDDLLGYKAIDVYEDDEINTKRIDTYRFDFSCKNYYHFYEDYRFDNNINDYVLEQKTKTYYKLLDENGSYVETFYYIDLEVSNDYIFGSETTVKYNKRGQELLKSVKYEDYDNPGNYYFGTYLTYEYDEEGYPLKVTSYNYESESYILYIESLDRYIYNSDKSYCTKKSYYCPDDTLIDWGYDDIDIKEENGLLVFTSTNYDNEGTKGNTVVRRYNKDFKTVYASYPAMPSETGMSLNDYGQVTSYFDNDDYFERDIAVDATYEENGGNILTCDVSDTIGSYSSTYTTNFEYNDLKQTSKVIQNHSYTTGRKTTNYDRECNVTYSSYQNDALLKAMNFYEHFIYIYGYDILVDQIII